MTTPPTVDFDRARSTADALFDQWQLEELTRPFAPHRWEGTDDHLPVLHLEDVTGIPFVEAVSGVEEYQHRARVRADDGELFAAATRPADGYEQYCREVLQLGAPEFIHAKSDNSMAVARACMQPAVFERLVRRAGEAGGLVIHPYMTIEPVWQLARRLAESSGTTVQVVGPPPPVLWVANDKSRCCQLVEQTLSGDWLVATERSNDPHRLVETMRRLAEDCNQVGLKRTRCASAMGNAVFDAGQIRRSDEATLLARVQEFLERTEWECGEDVLVVEWCDTDLSPSTQLWIPPEGHGPPRLEGIYEQILEGPEKIFVGSRPSTLPEPVDRALGDASLQLCAALQRLGYNGRCSFDFIVSGDPKGEFDVRFIECNGRWGGTSTPMRLVDRLIDGERPAYIATDYYLPKSHRGMSFKQLRARLEQHLFDPVTGEGRFVLYNVGPLRDYGKFDIISLGESPQDASYGLQQLLPRLLEL